MFSSIIQERGAVSFPGFNAEKHYMIPFFKKYGLPKHLSHWQDTVDDMLDGIDTNRPIYFMADQAFVKAGTAHRRPGVHVDGYWDSTFVYEPNPPQWRLYGHGGGGRHQGVPTHKLSPGHWKGVGTHRRWERSAAWGVVDFSYPEAMLLASNVSASAAYIGEYDGKLISEGGDARVVPLGDLAVQHLGSHLCHAGTVGTLHESLPLNQDAYRTMVRLNCPGVTIQ